MKRIKMEDEVERRIQVMPYVLQILFRLHLRDVPIPIRRMRMDVMFQILSVIILDLRIHDELFHVLQDLHTLLLRMQLS